uniref:Ycf54 n=1 Tax=Protohalopteris sp. TaxID=2843287 RepID=A0A8F0JXG4_9PHAE|nr:hypothetical protein [Protohalopteris sp.]
MKIKKSVTTTYYFILASDKFLLKDEPLEEVLRERVQHYQRVEKSIDFWLVQSPQFYTSDEFSYLRINLPNISECTAIISTEKSFITWLKLRFNNVAVGHFLAPTNEIPNPLGSY